MRDKTINMRRGAFGQPSVPFLLSRRAHLLTTPKGRWYCLRQPCALRGGCGFCGSLMDNATALRRCCHCPRSRLYVLLHHQNSCFRFGNNSPPACENLPPAVLSQLRVSLLLRHPFSFLRKRNKNENEDERTVRTNGDLPLGSQSGQPRYGTVCGCRFRLSELYQHLE